MPEPGDEFPDAGPTRVVRDRADGVATLVAILWVAAVAVAFSSAGTTSRWSVCWPSRRSSRRRSPARRGVGWSASWRPRSTRCAGADHSYGGLNHTLRVVTTLAATALAMWISQLRVERTVAVAHGALSETKTNGGGASPPR